MKDLKPKQPYNGDEGIDGAGFVWACVGSAILWTLIYLFLF